MTNTPETEQALVTVTQEDRIAVADNYIPSIENIQPAGWVEDARKFCLAGFWDSSVIVQAFARHREQAQRQDNPTDRAERIANHMGATFAQRTEPSAGEVERVARAMCGHDLEWRDCSAACMKAMKCAGNINEYEIALATAAIQAMRGGQGERAGIVAEVGDSLGTILRAAFGPGNADMLKFADLVAASKAVAVILRARDAEVAAWLRENVAACEVLAARMEREGSYSDAERMREVAASQAGIANAIERGDFLPGEGE